MDSRQSVFFAVAVVLIAAGPHACRAGYEEYGAIDMGMGMGNEYGGYKAAMEGAVRMSHQSPPPPQCHEVTTCTCTCVPKPQCSPQPTVLPCPPGTTRHFSGRCVPLAKPPCGICNICRECADEKISLNVKTCLQLHSDSQNSLTCLQAAGLSSRSARNLVNARSSPGFMNLLEQP